jgi:hypothetical protein
MVVVVSYGNTKFQCYSNNTILYIGATIDIIHAHGDHMKNGQVREWGVIGYKTFLPAHII